MAGIHNESGKNPFSDDFMKCAHSEVTLRELHSTIVSLILILHVLHILHSGNYFHFLPHVALAWAITVSSSSERDLFQNTNLESSAVEQLHSSSFCKE